MAWSVAGLEDIPSTGILTDEVSWLKACADVEEGRCLVLRHGDVFLPLCTRKKCGLVVLEGLGQDLRSVCGHIGGNGSGLPNIDPEHLPERADVVDLRRLPERCLPSLFPECGMRVMHDDAVWYAREMGISTDEFLKSLATNTRKELKYSKNRVEKTFGTSNVRYRPVRLDLDTLENSWVEAASITPHTWQGKNGVSVLLDAGKKQFVKNLVHYGMPVYFHFFHLGDDLASVAISMEQNGQFLIYAHEYNINFAKYRPGSLINMNMIENAMDNGAHVLDFGIGDTPNKRMMRCASSHLWRLLVPLTWKGWLAVTYQRVRWQAGRLKKNTECGKKK
jgi:hypothetical protein